MNDSPPNRAFHISEMTGENGFVEDYNRWGTRKFRQQKPAGNWHVIFENYSENGMGHWDKYNATGSLQDKFDHLSLWVSEKLGTSEKTGRQVVASGVLVGIVALARHLNNRSR